MVPGAWELVSMFYPEATKVQSPRLPTESEPGPKLLGGGADKVRMLIDRQWHTQAGGLWQLRG